MGKRFKSIAAYYDAENSPHDMLKHDVGFFLKHLKKKQSVLELAVGTGRAAIPIVQAGHRVVGVDYDASVLAVAKKKRDALDMGPDQLKLVRCDALKVDLKEKFDWVAVFFNTFLNFTSLEDQDRLLSVIRRHLRPNGKLWIDIFQPNLELLSHEHSNGLEPGTFTIPALNRTVYRYTEIHVDPTRQVQRVTFHYQWYNAAGKRFAEKRSFDLTFLFPRELQLLLERNGFSIQTLYGDYDGSSLDVHSPRIICLAKLPGR